MGILDAVWALFVFFMIITLVIEGYNLFKKEDDTKMKNKEPLTDFIVKRNKLVGSGNSVLNTSDEYISRLGKELDEVESDSDDYIILLWELENVTRKKDLLAEEFKVKAENEQSEKQLRNHIDLRYKVEELRYYEKTYYDLRRLEPLTPEQVSKLERLASRITEISQEVMDLCNK